MPIFPVGRSISTASGERCSARTAAWTRCTTYAPFASSLTDVNECYAALGIVHNLWSYIPGEFDDYIANPKENDYRSLHTAVVGPEGKTVEVQIRSRDMHKHAELGVAAHWRYKEGGGSPAAFDQKIRFLRHLLEPTGDGADLLDQIRDDFFEDRIYAVSPKGDVVELPANATPLDFAYHVHTQVGHRCRGAKINGRIVPLTHQVENGDQIEIITGSQAQPSRDWLSPKLGYLAGARARAKVRNWFRHQDRDQHIRQGREILDRELARLSEKDVPTDDIAKKLKHKDTESLYVALGAGDLTSASIATALQNLAACRITDNQTTPAGETQRNQSGFSRRGRYWRSCCVILLVAAALSRPSRSLATSLKVVASAFTDRIVAISWA